MRRLQLFEFNDQPWLPQLMRTSLTDALGHGIRSSRLFEPIAPLFVRFLQRAGTREVLDLCSGSGEPISVLLEALTGCGQPLPHVLLSDMFPDAQALHAVASRHPGHVQIAGAPVDALAVPASLHARARTIVNALHHFPPHAVEQMLQHCVRSGSALFILESFPRSVPHALRLAPEFAWSLYRDPLRSSRARLLKGMLTWIVPVLPAMGATDLVVSALRIHALHELQAMVARLPASFAWEGGLVPYRGRDQVLYFFGVPRR